MRRLGNVHVADQLQHAQGQAALGHGALRGIDFDALKARTTRINPGKTQILTPKHADRAHRRRLARSAAKLVFEFTAMRRERAAHPELVPRRQELGDHGARALGPGLGVRRPRAEDDHGATELVGARRSNRARSGQHDGERDYLEDDPTTERACDACGPVGWYMR